MLKDKIKLQQICTFNTQTIVAGSLEGEGEGRFISDNPELLTKIISNLVEPFTPLGSLE
jgi:hypothetical protein